MRPRDQYALEELESSLNQNDEFGDFDGDQIEASVEIVDVDATQTPKARSIFSTRFAGSSYSGAIRVFRKGTLVLLSDGPN